MAAFTETVDRRSKSARKRSRSWRWWRRIGWIAAWLLTAAALFYAVENWRGRRAWNAYVAELKSRGDGPDPAALVSPMAPENENFALLPTFEEIERVFESRRSKEAEQRDRQNPALPAPSLSSTLQKLFFYTGKPRPWVGPKWDGSFIDLVEWQKFLRNDPSLPQTPQPQSPAEDVLLALSAFDKELGEFQATKRHSQARVLVRNKQVGESIVQHTSALHSFMPALGLRGSARLALGEMDGAYEDLLLAFRFPDSLANESDFVASVVREQLTGMPLQLLWQGLVRHQWSEAQLATAEERLATVDLAEHFQRGLRGLRNLDAFVKLEQFRREPNRMWEDRSWNFNGPSQWVEDWLGQYEGWFPGKEWPYKLFRSLFSFSPGGWYDQNKVSVGRGLDHLMTSVDPKTKRFFPERANNYQQEIARQSHELPAPYTAFAQSYMTRSHGMNGIGLRFAATQGRVHLARIAIALERYRIRHGDYPENLKALDQDLVPAGGIPNDPASGTEPHYSRISNESFKLYFNGWNGIDEGGKLGVLEPDMRKRREKGVFNRDAEGDWVWPQPAM